MLKNKRNKSQDEESRENQMSGEGMETQNQEPEASENVTEEVEDANVEPTAEQKEIEHLEDKLKELSAKYLQLVAEFDNYKKRTAREKLDMSESAGVDVIKPILEVLDDMDRAEEEFNKQTELSEDTKGVLLIFGKLRNILKSKGLERMEAKDEDFDPELHDAMAEVPVQEDEKRGKVFDVINPGYKLKSKIIRHAKVVVGK